MTHPGKPITRRTVLSRRDLMTEADRVAASARIAATIDALLPAGTVALYAAKSTEVDLAGLDADLRARGVRVVYPRVVPGQRVLELAEGNLAPGTFGLREPTGAAVPLDEIAAFVVPGIAFDREGGRLGWGGGYYDATLALARPDARRIGVAYDCQLVERIPRDAHDIKLDLVVTETATYGGE